MNISSCPACGSNDIAINRTAAFGFDQERYFIETVCDACPSVGGRSLRCVIEVTEEEKERLSPPQQGLAPEGQSA